jgi:hypothetical protein
VFLSDTALIERNVYFEKAARAGRIDGVDDTLDMRSKQRPLLPTELRVPLTKQITVLSSSQPC